MNNGEYTGKKASSKNWFGKQIQTIQELIDLPYNTNIVKVTKSVDMPDRINITNTGYIFSWSLSTCLHSIRYGLLYIAVSNDDALEYFHETKLLTDGTT